MSAAHSSSHPGLEDRLCSELRMLASAHAAVADAIGRMVRAIATGRETLIGIEQLRLRTAVDQYCSWASGIRAVLEASDEDVGELRARLSRMQGEFRAELESRAAELMTACSPAARVPQREAPSR